MFQPQFKTTAISHDGKQGVFTLEPLEQGFGHTLGNALRRTLLSSISGWAITAVKINGVKHQFSTLAGLKEDVVELILNLKQVVIRGKGDEPVVLKINAKGPKQVTAKDIVAPAHIKIVNPDLSLVRLADKKAKLECELHFAVGYGYRLAEEQEGTTVGLIPVDSAFSPITQVSYRIESARVGRRSDYDRLIMEIASNGSVDPQDALMGAARLLTSYFKQVYDPVFVKPAKEEKPITLENVETMNLTVEELDLPTRIANALRKGGYPTVRDLVNASYDEVSRVKNLGGKSLTIIQDRLKQKGITIFQGK